jgi:lysophospholipase L1-like esterase
MISYLALGDSYTVGEQVALFESFPYQLVHGLRRRGQALAAPEIVAKTGWTTDELMAGIAAIPLIGPYDLVTLLIGVNNQYRERPVESYTPEFSQLLEQAIGLAGGQKARVAVLSIPDWGVTPFAHDRDQNAIATAIDAYNSANRSITEAQGVAYFDITPFTREARTDRSLLAADGLHPSGKDYARWATLIMNYFEPLLSQ